MREIENAHLMERDRKGRYPIRHGLMLFWNMTVSDPGGYNRTRIPPFHLRAKKGGQQRCA